MTAPVQTRTDHLAGSQVPTSVQAPTAAQAVPPSPGFLNIKQSYLDALEALGYTESEARFLYVVATHSGYFVARQFLAFTCGHWGKRTTAFWHKLHTKKHARTEYFPMNGKVYHAFSRRLYRQIGRENLRNRREHEFEYIQRRIGMLDFVLSHPEYKYLETELEKVSYFCDQLKVPTHFLPAKTYYGQKTSQPTVRYFVDKFPMFFDSDTSSPSPAVTFTYIQGPEASLTEFVHHLQAYLPLFRQLSAFRFLYLARVDSHFEKAKELFNSTAAIPLGSDTSAELCRYFQVRKAWDLRQYRSVSDGDLIFRNQAKTRFVGGTIRTSLSCRALPSSLYALEEVPEVVASERVSPTFRHSQRNAVGSELAAETKVQTLVSCAGHPCTARRWLPRLPSRECHSDEQFWCIAEIASAETRTRGWLASHGDNLHPRDQRGWETNRRATWQRSLGSFGPQLDPERRTGS